MKIKFFQKFCVENRKRSYPGNDRTSVRKIYKRIIRIVTLQFFKREAKNREMIVFAGKSLYGKYTFFKCGAYTEVYSPKFKKQ